eukprot:11086119-Alexandrium_andersonii.AAC.1
MVLLRFGVELSLVSLNLHQRVVGSCWVAVGFSLTSVGVGRGQLESAGEVRRLIRTVPQFMARS